MQTGFIFLNVFLICALGLLTSFTDLRSGKVPNKFVFPAIVAGVLLNFLGGSSWLFFLLNAVIAFLFGFLLFLARLWSAADAKLFLAFAVLFPSAYYSAAFFFFPSFAIVINSFLPAFFALFLVALFRTSIGQKVAAARVALAPKEVAFFAVTLFAFYWIVSYLFSFLGVPLDFFLMVLVLFLVVEGVEMGFPGKTLYFSAALAVFFLMLQFNAVTSPAFLLGFFLTLAVMLFLRLFVVYLGFFAFGKRVEISGLKAGMVLLEGVFEKKGFLEKKKLFFPCLLSALEDIKTNYAVDLSPRGLSEKDIALIRRKEKDGKARFHSLLVQETLPFAPLLFAGTIISFFCSLLPWC